MIRTALRHLRVRAVAAQMAMGGDSRRRLTEMLEEPRRDEPGAPERIALRGLNGGEILIRPGSADPDVALGAFYGRYHLPKALPSPALIWDLGCNIGLTMRQMAEAYPGARVVGVELDPENLELAEQNLAPVRDRCELVEGAVWPESGTVTYGTPSGEDAYRIDSSGETVAAGAAEAVPLDALIERFGAPDYVKMDIEGAESDVLKRNVGWSRQVSVIGVEYHPPYTLDECKRDLRALGFSAFDPHERGLLRRGSDTVYASRG